MLEEIERVMEKKTQNRSPAPAKNNGIEKKNNDSNKYPRNPKRREPTGVNRSQDFGRNNFTPRSRSNYDRRPKPRGSTTSRASDEIVEAWDTENCLGLNFGTKKVNLNHLLNFSFAPRESSSSHNWRSGNRNYGGYRRSHRVSYNKEQFLQANCQFIVDEDGDYTIHFIDADKLVDWEHIQQVRIYSHELPSCPICLQYPTAAKITRCGHIYCWPCVLHYLTLDDKPWRKCPICYESIIKKDLKSVVTCETHQYCVGEEITMYLMKKEKGSTTVAPVSTWEKKGEPYTIHDKYNTRYSKILKATSTEVENDILQPEFEALNELLKAAEPSEVCFIESALAELKEKKDALSLKVECEKEINEIINNVSEESDSPSSPDMLPDFPLKLPAYSKPSKIYRSAFSDDEEELSMDDLLLDNAEEICASPSGSSDNHSFSDTGATADSFSEEQTAPSPKPADEGATAESFLVEQSESSHVEMCVGSPDMKPTSSDLEGKMADSMPVEEAAEHLELPHDNEKSRKRNAGNPTKDSFYFYQAADGQHIYLHALNARCLVREYGSLQNSPPSITATIVEKENIFMTEELRKRLRYLNHLPLTGEFEVAEMKLKPPILSKQTLHYFSVEIEKRRRARQKKLREEKAITKRIQIEQSKDVGIIYPSLMTSLENARHRPSPSSLETSSSGTISPSLDTAAGTTPPACSAEAHDVVAGSSPTDNVDNDGNQTSFLSFAQMLRDGKNKPTPKKETPASVPVVVTKTGTGSDTEEHVPAPVFQYSFSDAIEAAFKNLDKSKDDTSLECSEVPVVSKKKKKLKMVPLFSTSMARK